jgi:hypothetical protein
LLRSMNKNEKDQENLRKISSERIHPARLKQL